MIPLRDDHPTRTFAVLTIGLIVVNVLVFLREFSLPGEESLQSFFSSYALIPASLTQGLALLECLTVVTSMFLHGGWLHLLGNMLFLWVFGKGVEDSIGHFWFLIFYLVCGTVAALTQVAIDPQSTVPIVGASGAISGVLGAYLMLFPRARVLVLLPIWIFIRFFQVPAWLMLVFWFGLQLLSGALTQHQMQTGGVAVWAHIGGFVAGMMLIPLFKKKAVRLFQ